MKPKHLLALGVLLVGVTAGTSLLGAQKPAPPQPTEQQKLKERVDALESQLQEAQAKADRAAVEKDYIGRIQKQYESYYEKVLSTQTTSLTILGITLTAVFTLGGLFSLKVFDDRTKNAIATALTELEAKFNEKTQAEAEKLRKENAADVKELQTSLTKRIEEMAADLRAKADFQFQYAQGLAAAAGERYASSRSRFLEALKIYKAARDRNLFDTEDGRILVGVIFQTLRREDEKNYAQKAKAELAQELYDDLDDELSRAAVQIDWLAPLVRDRKAAPPAAEPATPTAAPATAQESNAPDKDQAAKPQGEKK